MKFQQISYHHKNFILFEVVNIANIQISSMVSKDEKSYQYFNGYIDDDHIIGPLHLLLPKTSAYVKS